MTDELKDRLERLGDRADEGSDALERLRDARERRDRRRARSALAVGLSVVIVGALVAVTLRGDGATPAPGVDGPTGEVWELPETPYLWPENWARPEGRQALADAQAAADAGITDVVWRLDPEQVVGRFLGSVLAWEQSDVREMAVRADGHVFAAQPACPRTASCDWNSSLRIVVRQPLVHGESGVWSVLQATSEPLGIRSSLGQSPDLLAGSSVGFELDLPEDRSAHAGLVASNGCRETSEFALALGNGTSSVQVPAAEPQDESCGEVGAGYLFVYAMDDTTVPTGDPLLEAAAIEYPWLTMVPVEVQMGVAPASSDEAAPVAIIECSGPGVSGTEVLTPVVAAQVDGVHVEIRNTSDEDLGISFATRGDDADVGTTELVLDSPPGAEEALCTGDDTDPGDAGVPFEIVDPDGYWVSTELDGGACSVMNVDYGEMPAGIADPIEAARDALGSRIEEGDELVLAGYPEAAVEKVVVLRRGGVPIISVAMFEGTEGWFEHTVTTCG